MSDIETTVQKSLEEYRQQYKNMQEQLQMLDKNYAEQRAVGHQAINQIAGAIAALEQLVKEVDEPVDPPASN